MASSYVGGPWWDAAARHILDDPDGVAIRRSQALWARAVREDFPPTGDVVCGGAVFGPAVVVDAGTGFVVTRPEVLVVSDDRPAAVLACESAWRRWRAVDDNGDEHDQVYAADLPGDGVDFGYPQETGDGVLVGFDVRFREEPLPHRARTCLRILGQELRRHGAAPATLVNPLTAADDVGVNVEALADQVDLSPQPGTEPGVDRAGRSARPDWLPPFHQVTRSRRASPSGPVPFVVISSLAVWAWDPAHGLLKLPGWKMSPAPSTHMHPESLTPDGTQLRFDYRVNAVGTPESERRKVATYNIATAEITLEPWDPVITYAASPHGPWLKVTPPPPALPHGTLRYDDYAYELLEGPDRTSRPLHISRPLAAVHFSATRRRLLTEHIDSALTPNITVTDLKTGDQDEHHRVRVGGSAPWSPDETRCLVKPPRREPAVLDLRTKQTTPLNVEPIDPDDEPISRARIEVLGWLDDHGVAVLQRLGRRFRISYQTVDSMARYPVLDFPISTPSAYVSGITLAPDVLTRTPQAIGLS